MPAQNHNRQRSLFKSYYRETSAQAFAAAKLSGNRRKVLDAIRHAGANGMTNDELVGMLGIPLQSVTPTTNYLRNADIIIDSGERRLTRCNRWAIVFVIASADEVAEL